GSIYGADSQFKVRFNCMQNNPSLEQASNTTAPGSVPEDEDFATLFEQSLLQGSGGDIKEGEITHGTVVAVLKDFVVVDIGYKSEGQVSLSEFANASGEISVKEGDSVEVLVEAREN